MDLVIAGAEELVSRLTSIVGCGAGTGTGSGSDGEEGVAAEMLAVVDDTGGVAEGCMITGG
jgi:hypothetical protein